MARRRLRTTRTLPRMRRDGGGERPRDDHEGMHSRPTGHDRDKPVAPRVEVTLVESAGDAGAGFAKRARERGRRVRSQRRPPAAERRGLRSQASHHVRGGRAFSRSPSRALRRRVFRQRDRPAR